LVLAASATRTRHLHFLGGAGGHKAVALASGDQDSTLLKDQLLQRNVYDIKSFSSFIKEWISVVGL